MSESFISELLRQARERPPQPIMDTFRFRDTDMEAIGWTSTELFHPNQFGIVPTSPRHFHIQGSPRCLMSFNRGFHCTYSIDEESATMVLSDLHVVVDGNVRVSFSKQLPRDLQVALSSYFAAYPC